MLVLNLCLLCLRNRDGFAFLYLAISVFEGGVMLQGGFLFFLILVYQVFVDHLFVEDGVCNHVPGLTESGVFVAQMKVLLENASRVFHKVSEVWL